MTVCFAGNPNVGKSTLFNALTGLRQHTGNWTGKTVDPARGHWVRQGIRYDAVDLPGIYSLSGGTPEELVASDYLRDHAPDLVVVILDATALERSLPLAFELRSRCRRMLVCLNLIDEAKRLGLCFDRNALQAALRAPAVETVAHKKVSVESLRSAIADAVRLPAQEPEEPEVSEAREKLLARAEQVSRAACPAQPIRRRDPDRIVLGKLLGYPLVLLLVFLIILLTVWGANLPSRLLERAFAGLECRLRLWLRGCPVWLAGFLIDGIYGTSAKVVSVMLPPMAIFFPLFSLLEDFGYLPRAAVLLDRPFACAGTCGRQGLTMCMGCGCNAVGVTGCRILQGRNQRLAAILTNALMPCNGRFSTLILLCGILLGSGPHPSPLATAGILTGILLLSVAVTLLITRLLRRTVLKGEDEPFVLELPPFRRPNLRQVLLRSLVDRTMKILGRAVTVAAPAGALIWILAVLRIEGRPLLSVLAGALDPAAALLGLSGGLLLAFFLSFPANELLLPLAVLISSAGMTQSAGLGEADLNLALTSWHLTPVAALCAALFTLFHWPCSTTVLTIRKETGSRKWTLAAVLLPTAVGVVLCFTLHSLAALVS